MFNAEDNDLVLIMIILLVEVKLFKESGQGRLPVFLHYTFVHTLYNKLCVEC